MPTLYDKNMDFAVNKLPAGYTIEAMSTTVANLSNGSCLPALILNGFMCMVRRHVFHTIGYFDEINFPSGYGEEVDFSLRATRAGFRISITDNVYVYHFKSRSFGPELRHELIQRSMRVLATKYTRKTILNSWRKMGTSRPLSLLRSNICTTAYRGIGC